MARSKHIATGSGYRDASPELNVGASTHTNLSKRQLRVRKRKEWVRKVDVSGTLYWYRDGEAGIDPHYPGYTLEYAVNTHTAVLAQHSLVVTDLSFTYTTPSTMGDVQTIVDTGASGFQSPSTSLRHASAHQTHLLSKNSVVQMLNNETQTLTTPARTVATLANPERMPVRVVDQRPPPIILWLDVLQLVSQDFPTKHAHFVAKTSRLLSSSQIASVYVIRLSLLDDSMQCLSLIPRASIRSSLRVAFHDETGIDAGGLKREWFELLTQQLCKPANDVLKCVNMSEQTYYLNPHSKHEISDDHLLYYFATGRLIGRALLEGQTLGFHLALSLLKTVLGLPVSLSDLAYFDSRTYKSMLWIEESTGVDTLGLDFSVVEVVNGEALVVDLIENGRNISVNDENKDLYLEHKFRYLLFESVSSQLYAFLKGLYEVIPQELLMLFDPEEFDLLLCGSDAIDVDDWEKHTTFTDDLRGHDVKKWFWEILRAMPNEYRRRLLHFTTGSTRVPLTGFSALTSFDGQLSPFTLHGVKLSEGEYIWSHACFNRLGLPLYESREMVEKALYAVLELDLYGFSTE